MKAQIPVLQGSSDTRVTNFNNEMTLLTQEEIAKFKDNAAEVRVPTGSSGSTYDQQYKLLSPPGNLISLQFQIKIFIYQTSRPKTHSRTVNYDLEAGADVTMDQLFLPGSDYLARISNYCIAQLKTRPIDFESYYNGAQPSPANYGNWNITPTGLQITFAENQVAAYGTGSGCSVYRASSRHRSAWSAGRIHAISRFQGKFTGITCTFLVQANKM